MSDPFEGKPFPRAALAGAGLLIAATLAFAAANRIFGAPASSKDDTPVRIERALRFVDRSAGGVDVVDADTGRSIVVLRPSEDGFIRATVRGLAQERRRRGLDDTIPFRLALRSDGRLTLEDPATARTIQLRAFGPTNAAAFARLLPNTPSAGPAVASLADPAPRR